MFFVYLFIASATILGVLFFVWNLELSRSGRFFNTYREWLDGECEYFKKWLEENVTPENLIRHGQHFATYVTHHGARIMARFAHVLEYRARTVVHRTARRVRKQAHYLEGVVEEKLDRIEKKGNNTASEQ